MPEQMKAATREIVFTVKTNAKLNSETHTRIVDAVGDTLRELVANSDITSWSVDVGRAEAQHHSRRL